jgi:integrase
MRTKPQDDRLYWRGTILWCRVPGSNGRIRRRTTKCTDEAAASARADEFERRFADPRHAAAAAATLEGSLRAYYRDLERRNRSAATRGIARQKCGHFVRLWGLGLTMAELEERGPQMVLDYIDRRTVEGAKPFTVKKELDQLSQVLRIARYLGVFRRPFEELFPPFFSGGHKPRTRAPSFAEVRALLAQFHRHRAAHVLWFVATGSRVVEAERARRDDVDFDRGVVTIRGTKTDLAKGLVAITPLTRPLLEWSLAHAPGKDLLFQPWGKYWRDIVAACVRAGIPKVTPNDLRRSFGHWHRDALMRAGVGEKSAAELTSKLLRHTTDKLAQTTYANVGGETVSQAIALRLEGVPGLEIDPPEGVSDLYAPTASTGATDVQSREENSLELAPSGRVELPTFGLGSLSHRLLSEGTKKGIERKRAERTVPELYPADLLQLPAFSTALAGLKAIYTPVRDGVEEQP